MSGDQQQCQETLLEALRRPALYPHPVDTVEHVETHISHVLLAGEFAYKIKKPLDLGFLDFSTLARRRFCCEEELRLNSRLAPRMYQAVVGFTGTPRAPVINGDGEPFEYAVRMKRFDRGQELDRLLEAGRLPREWMDELAGIVAAFHRDIPRCGADSPLGAPGAVLQPMEENFEQLAPLLDGPGHQRQLAALREYTRAGYQRLRPLLARRHREGFVRECHGDMHLGNMTRFDGALVIFDGIEFSEALRWIDVISEVAFLTMDLTDRGAPAHAARFFNAWLEHSGDYEGVALLRFYEIYRAMVRAKVAGIRMSQARAGEAGNRRRDALRACEGYLRLAGRLSRGAAPALFINHGLSGSGKTIRSQAVVEALGAIRIRSDVERKRLAGMDALQRGDSEVGAGIYSRDMSRRTYVRLEQLCEDILGAGFPVIADATFLRRADRRRFLQLARRLHVPCAILDHRAPEPVLRQRIRARSERDDEASDAGLAVLDHQLGVIEPPQDDEPVIAVEHDCPLPLERIEAVVEERLSREPLSGRDID